MEIDYKDFGNQIQKCRKAKQLTQEELAEKCGISVSHLQYIESGLRRGSLDAIFTISNVLEVPIDALLLGQGFNYQKQYNLAMHSLFDDCTRYEAKIIYETALEMKRTMKENARLLYDSRNR